VKVTARVIVFQPNGTSLLVGEEYTLQNQSQPPVAYFNAKGDFEFELPQGGELSQVSSWGPSGMPVVQGTMNRGNQKHAIAYAFQPGDNGVRLSYQVPYASNKATLKFVSGYTAERVLVVAPPTMQISSAGFSPSGNEQGYNLYARENMPAGLPFEVSISGTAPPPSAADPQQGADQGQDQVNGRATGAALQVLPNRLDGLKSVLIIGFAVLFAMGLTLIWRRPFAVAGGAEATGLSAPALGGPGPRSQRRPKAAKTPPPPVTSAVAPAVTERAAQATSEVEREVEQSLDGLKDMLFRLELRRQAGTISEEEYALERSRAEKVLRELVRG
jgi:hypothetical protein